MTLPSQWYLFSIKHGIVHVAFQKEAVRQFAFSYTEDTRVDKKIRYLGDGCYEYIPSPRTTPKNRQDTYLIGTKEGIRTHGYVDTFEDALRIYEKEAQHV